MRQGRSGLSGSGRGRAIAAALVSLLVVLVGAGPASAENIFAVNAAGSLVRFDSAAPGAVTTLGPVTGLQSGEEVEGIDFRPLTGQLYALGSTGRLYTLSRTTGAATPVGREPTTSALSGSDFAFDFNPVLDRIRVFSDTEENLEMHPDTGRVTARDAPLNPASEVVGAAYTNNVINAHSTTLYGIDAGSRQLVRVGGPGGLPAVHTGSVTRIGQPFEFDPSKALGFDVSGVSGVAFLSTNDEPPSSGVSVLRKVDLDSGATRTTGEIGGGSQVRALAVALPPSVIEFERGYAVSENVGSIRVFVRRSGNTDDPATVQYRTSDESATAGSDYTAASGTLSFGPDERVKTFDVAVTDDAAIENTESFRLELVEASGGVIGPVRNIAVTVFDNDRSRQQISGISSPPVVDFTAPAIESRLNPDEAVMLSADASDDNGVAAVTFLARNRVVCTDTTAPYTCSYVPILREIGNSALSAVAVDGDGLTASDRRPVFVRRFVPVSLTATTVPRRDQSSPYRFRTSGRLRLPDSIRSRAVCGRGVVEIKYRSALRSVTRVARLKRNCRYSAEPIVATRRKGAVEVETRFLGNVYLQPVKAPREKVRAR